MFADIASLRCRWLPPFGKRRDVNPLIERMDTALVLSAVRDDEFNGDRSHVPSPPRSGEPCCLHWHGLGQRWAGGRMRGMTALLSNEAEEPMRNPPHPNPLPPRKSCEIGKSNAGGWPDETVLSRRGCATGFVMWRTVVRRPFWHRRCDAGQCGFWIFRSKIPKAGPFRSGCRREVGSRFDHPLCSRISRSPSSGNSVP